MFDERFVENYISLWYEIKYTGISPYICITCKSLKESTPILRVEYRRGRCATMTLEEHPRVIGYLPLYAQAQARQWMQQNLPVLLRHWHGDIDACEATKQVMAVRRHGDRAALSPSERAYILSINARLRKIQDHVIREAEQIIPQLKTRVADVTDPLVDFEVEVRVSYHLREDDPAYDENDDNIFIEQEESVTHILDYDDHCYRSRNWNAMQGIEGHPLQHEYHCWFYHDLYDHHALDFHDLLRIGWIWVDIKTIYQYMEDLEGKQDGWRKA
jgi:hypothetical protein